MLDGGPSTQFGYERIDRHGYHNRDQAAPHGVDESGAGAVYVASILYATSRDLYFIRHHRRHRHRHAARR